MTSETKRAVGWATHGGRGTRPPAGGAAASAAALALLALLLPVGAASSRPGAGTDGGYGAGGSEALDPKAGAVWKALTDALGGQETWERLPYLRFDFVVEREGKELARFRHWWDRARGRCRVEGPDEKGRVITAIFNLADRKGKSFTDGISDTDSANVAGILQNGYERWVNDTYWLAMPFKLHDPGARLRYDREERGPRGEPYDVLALSFAPGTGLTSEDRYWLFVNRATHLIDRWEFVLQGRKPPPEGFVWTGWTAVGPIRLSLERSMVGKNTRIRFENVAAPAAMDERVFTHARAEG